MENFEEKYKKALEKAKVYHNDYTKDIMEDIFPELRESEDEKIRKVLIKFFSMGAKNNLHTDGIADKAIIAWLEKQGLKSNPYSGVSFNYNGNTWGMCARDNGVDILFNRKLIQHISDEKQGEQKPADKVEPKFKAGDIIEYVGERKELIDGKYEIKEIGKDFYVTTYGTIIPFKFEEYYINKTKPKFRPTNGTCRIGL